MDRFSCGEGLRLATTPALTRREFLFATSAALIGSRAKADVPQRDLNEDLKLRAVVNSVIGNQSEETRQRFAGLMIAEGIARRYAAGRISRADARRDLDDLLRSKLIRDPAMLTDFAGALEGKISDPVWEQVSATTRRVTSAVGGVVGLRVPGAGLAITLLGEWTPDAVELMLSPGSPFALYPQPRRDPVLLAGAVAFSALNDELQRSDRARRLLEAYVPGTDLNLSLSGSPLAAVNHLNPADREFIREATEAAIRGSAREFGTAVDRMTGRLFERFDRADQQSRELLALLTDQRRREEALEKARQIELERQYIQGEVAGAVSIVSSFATLVFQNPQLGKQISGVYGAVSGLTGLISSFSAGSIGVFALTGGVGNVVMGLSGLFGPSQNDFLIERLGVIERKLDVLLEVVRQGFVHLDERLDRIQELSVEILRELARGNQQMSSRVGRLNDQIASLSRFVRESVWQSRENAVETALTRARYLLATPGQSLTTDVFAQTASALNTFTKECSQTAHVGYEGGEFRQLADFVGARESIAYQIGFLPSVAEIALVPSAQTFVGDERSHPNPDRWCEAAQALLHLLALRPERITSEPLRQALLDLWRQGSALRTDLINILLPEAIGHLARRLEAASLRESACNGRVTLEARLDQLARGEFVRSGRYEAQFIRLREALETQPGLMEGFESLALALRFILSMHGWRLSSDNGRERFRLVDSQLISCRADLIQLVLPLAHSLDESLGSRGIAPADRWPRVVDGIVYGFRQTMQADLARVRLLAQSLQTSPVDRQRRCGALDVALREVFSFASVQGISLPRPLAPVTTLLRRRNFESTRTLDAEPFQTFLRELAQASTNDFASAIRAGSNVQTGFVPLNHAMGDLPCAGLVRGGPANPEGLWSVARVDLPAPLNIDDGREQFEHYDSMIRRAFPGIEWDEYPPQHVRRHFPSDAVISERLRNYFRAPDGSAQFTSLLLMLREGGASMPLTFNHESTAITGADRSPTQVRLTLWAFTPKSCGFEQ